MPGHLDNNLFIDGFSYQISMGFHKSRIWNIFGCILWFDNQRFITLLTSDIILPSVFYSFLPWWIYHFLEFFPSSKSDASPTQSSGIFRNSKCLLVIPNKPFCFTLPLYLVLWLGLYEQINYRTYCNLVIVEKYPSPVDVCLSEYYI